MISRRLIGCAFAIVTSLAFAAGARATELRVLTHDSFDINPKLIAAFEKEHDTKVVIVKAGDAGATLNKLILTKSVPIADVVYGLDNLLLAKADAAGVLVPYTSAAAATVPETIKLGPDLTPVDYGYVALNYDKAGLIKAKVPLPQTLEDLTKPAFKNLLVVENPATSSTGLAFLAATIAHFGVTHVWQFWAALRDNGVKVDDGWTDAYEKDFSHNGGTRPIVVSYGTSPAAEVFYSKHKLTSSPTANLFLPGSTFLQVEGAGLVANGKTPALAQAFINFLLSPKVQADIPTRMWVYPVVPGVTLDKVFDYAETPKTVPPLAKPTADQTKGWVRAWTQVVLRGSPP